MRYKVHENSSTNRVFETVLQNRGIENPHKYMNLDDSCLINYRHLENIDKAVSCFLYHIENNSNIHILVDCDVDGYTSASMIYQYIKNLDKNINITYSLHTGKQHGITDDIIIPENINLIIVPDAGTNDTKQCCQLKEKGIDILILDHHLQDELNPYAILVNNQISSEYHNKELCGAGIVYKFLQASDNDLWSEAADDFLDLTALANIADCMDIKSFETKRLIEKGLYNIQNTFLQKLIAKQSYSIGSKLTIQNIQFYIVPLINALIRVGTQNDKDILFRAFIQDNAYFEYKTRAYKDKPSTIIQESIYDRGVRFCINAKSKQNKLVEKCLDKLCPAIEKNNLNKNKVMFVPIDNFVDKNLTGVTAIKLANKYNKPCLLLGKKSGTENIYAGSGRNINNSPISSLKDLLLKTNSFQKVAGHNNAFGIEINLANISEAIKKLDSVLTDINFQPYYYVDFELNYEDVSIKLINDIVQLIPYYGHGFEETRLYIKNIYLEKSQISLIGKNADTLNFISDNDITFIKFKCLNTEPLMGILNESWTDSKEILMNIVGRANINTYGNIKTPQIIIDDYELIKQED